MTAKRHCSSCKKAKDWPGDLKTCAECRARVAKCERLRKEGGPDRSAVRGKTMMQHFTIDHAWEVVEHAEAGLRDDQLAMFLKVTTEIFKQWRERGEKSVNPDDPFFVLYYEVNSVRVKRFAEKMKQLRDSNEFRAQIAWLEWAFPDIRPPRPPTQVLPKPSGIDPEKFKPKEIQFV